MKATSRKHRNTLSNVHAYNRNRAFKGSRQQKTRKQVRERRRPLNGYVDNKSLLVCSRCGQFRLLSEERSLRVTVCCKIIIRNIQRTECAPHCACVLFEIIMVAPHCVSDRFIFALFLLFILSQHSLSAVSWPFFSNLCHMA